jgi:hypothetical protein
MRRCTNRPTEARSSFTETIVDLANMIAVLQRTQRRAIVSLAAISWLVVRYNHTPT